MYVVNDIYSIKIYTHPGKSKMPTDNSFINFEEFLNEKYQMNMLKDIIMLGHQTKRRKVYLQKN